MVNTNSVLETGDFGERVLAEGDGVGEGLVSGGGHQGDTGGGVGDIHGGLGGAHLGSELSGDTCEFEKFILKFTTNSLLISLHGLQYMINYHIYA